MVVVGTAVCSCVLGIRSVSDASLFVVSGACWGDTEGTSSGLVVAWSLFEVVFKACDCFFVAGLVCVCGSVHTCVCFCLYVVCMYHINCYGERFKLI